MTLSSGWSWASLKGFPEEEALQLGRDRPGKRSLGRASLRVSVGSRERWGGWGQLDHTASECPTECPFHPAGAGSQGGL